MILRMFWTLAWRLAIVIVADQFIWSLAVYPLLLDWGRNHPPLFGMFSLLHNLVVPLLGAFWGLWAICTSNYKNFSIRTGRDLIKEEF